MQTGSGKRWRVRFGGFAAATLVTTAVGLAVGTPAHAATEIACPPNVGTLATPATPPAHPNGTILVPVKKYLFTVVSATPTFFVSDSRIAVNNLDTPLTVTFTSQQSQTITVTASVGSQIKLTEKLQETVNVQIQVARMTSIGVNVSAVIPAHSSVLGQYGVQGYVVTYDAQTITWVYWANRCYDDGTQRATTNAPTLTEGWQVSPA
jgi:hypothetical protein